MLKFLSWCICFLAASGFSAANARETSIFTPSLLQNTEASFQLAKTTFLPDYEDGDLVYEDDITPPQKTESYCDGYTLSSCPENALCEVCLQNSSLFKFSGCLYGYRQLGTNCIPASCAVLGYESSIETGKICSPVEEYGLECYKDCRSVNCSGYTLDCASKPEHALELVKCPDCNNSYAKCGNNVCKISKCDAGYKISADGTSCIALDDSCPENYYKECETGTTGEPVYTESGAVCYQCLPDKPAGIGDILYSDMTTSTEIISGKTPIGVVFDPDKKLAAALKDIGPYKRYANYDQLPRFNRYNRQLQVYNPLSNLKGAACKGKKYDRTNEICLLPTYGRTETDAITLNNPNLAFYPAMQGVSQYSTTGTKPGDWFMPNFEELLDLITVREVINPVLASLGGTEIKENQYDLEGNIVPHPEHKRYLSSTQNYYVHTETNPYYNINGVGISSIHDEDDKFDVRPVIDYNTYSCSGTGYAGGVGNEYRGKYLSCKCATNYIWNYGTKECENNKLQIGDYLYSDLTTGRSLNNGKKIIGVVFDTENRTAVELKIPTSFLYWQGTPSMNAALGKDDGKAPVFDVETLPNYPNLAEGIKDMDGKGNSIKIQQYCKAKNIDCIIYSNQWSDQNGPVDSYGVTNMYVPSAGQLLKIWQNIDIINKKFKDFNANINILSGYWSSTEADKDRMYCLKKGSYSGDTPLGICDKTNAQYGIIYIYYF